MELHQEQATAEREVSTMKAIIHERYGMPEVLELREVDVPTINDEQVLLRVRASSVNPAEWYGVTGPLFARLFGWRVCAGPRPRRWAPTSQGWSKRSART